MNGVEDEDSTTLKLYLGSFLNSVMKGGYFSYLGSFTTPGNHNKATNVKTWHVAIDYEALDNKIELITAMGFNEYQNIIFYNAFLGCNEVVTWVFFKKPIKISTEQVTCRF